MSKSKNKVRVSFVGNNSENVTGSMTLVDCGLSKKKLLLECGAAQEATSLLKQYQTNSKKFPFKPKDIDYCFLFHAHFDHQGLLPKLIKDGFAGRIIVPEGFTALYREMALDSASIMVRDAIDLSKKNGKEYPPIYTAEDVYASLSFFEEYPLNEECFLDDDISIKFISSGHIIGATQGIIKIKNGSNIRTIGYTSDLGNLSAESYYTKDFQPIKFANLLIGECTYSDRKRIIKEKDREKDLEKIQYMISNICINGNGSVLFPSFALHRTETILTVLYNLFSKDENFNIPIYICSPLATRIATMWDDLLDNSEQQEQWRNILSWNKIHFIDTFEKLQDVVDSKQKAIYVSSSGMLTAGYVLYIAKQILPYSKNGICLVGYAAEGTLAHKIKTGQKNITIDGKNVNNRCQSLVLNSFSSHMQRNDLLSYYSNGFDGQYGYECNYENVALVHGEFKAKCDFANDLKQEIEKKNRTHKVIVVNKSTEVTL